MPIIKSKPNSFDSKLKVVGPTGFVYRNTVIPVSWTDTTIGTDLPRHNSTIRDGGSATTVFDGVLSSITDLGYGNSITTIGPPGGGMNPPGTAKVSGYGTAPSFLIFSDSSLAKRAENAALGSFYSKARDAMSPAKGMTILGELRETIEMVRSPAKALRNGLDSYLGSLKKVNQKKSRQYKQAWLANTYLEYAFGWVPLISDTKDAVKAYNSLLDKHETVRIVAFGNAESAKVVSSVENPADVDFAIMNVTETQRQEKQVILRGAVRIKPSSTSSVTADRFGFNLNEFAPTVWELVPWSFLIDYFANVGDIISATTFANSNLAWTCRTDRTITELIHVGIPDAKAIQKTYSGAVVSGGGYGWSAKRTSIHRDTFTPSVPGLQFSLPVSPTRWLNIAALASQSKSLIKLFL